jgi:hypothetical protein
MKANAMNLHFVRSNAVKTKTEGAAKTASVERDAFVEMRDLLERSRASVDDHVADLRHIGYAMVALGMNNGQTVLDIARDIHDTIKRIERCYFEGKIREYDQNEKNYKEFTKSVLVGLVETMADTESK